jgi:inhibitor of KinA
MDMTPQKPAYPKNTADSFQIRNLKSETNPKNQNSNSQLELRAGFELQILNLFRISDFKFRISNCVLCAFVVNSFIMITFLPLGDQAAMAYFPDEAAALSFATAVRHVNPAWLVDVVQAYTSVAVFFDLSRTNFSRASTELQKLSDFEFRTSNFGLDPQVRRHRIPCCYELQLDMPRVAEHLKLSADEIIRLHSETVYTVYAIGFCPGFPYLGYLPPALCGVPRLDSPRPRLEAGSVGLTGRQAGIYTEPRPGGWHIIGRTPLELVHVADDYFPLRTGDKVQFERIDEKEFRQLKGQRL